jgi:integrase/recombinase XerD
MGHPGKQEYVVSKNLYLRNEIWWARFTVAGQEYRESLRTRSERVAEKRLKARREEIEDQTVYGIAGPISWLQAVISWNEHVAPSLGAKTHHRYATSLRQLRAMLDPLAVQQINAKLLADLIKTRRRAGVSNATIRRDLTALSSVMNHAADEHWIEDNPVDAVKRGRVVPEKTVPIVLPQPDSMARIFARIPTRMRDLCDFTRETGLRLDEVTGLQHRSIDRERGLITVEKGKGNKVRTVTMPPAAIEIMDRQPRFIGKPYVFWQGEGDRIINVSSRLGAYMRRAAQKAAQQGVEFHSFSHHDFRHLFAVEYLRDGRGSIYTLQGEMGHGTITVTERYLDYVTPDQAARAKTAVAQSSAHVPRFDGGEDSK